MDESNAALRRVCLWATATSLHDIPADVVVRIGAVAADTIACALAGSHDAELLDWAGSPSGMDLDGECTVLGWPGSRLPRGQAAARNAICANWQQLDEGHRHLMCHAGIYCVPAALAECEAENRSVQCFLRAVALGYEITCRLARAWTSAAAPLHPHSLWSTFGATATLGLLRGFSGERLFEALLHAASVAAPRHFAIVTDGGLAANLWVGMGVDHAFTCVEWVTKRLSAAGSALKRLSELLRAQMDASACSDDLGLSWAVRDNYFKTLPCAGQSHAALEALLQARASLAKDGVVSFDENVQIDAQVHDFGLNMGQRIVATSLAARFSIPHLLAVAWLHGRTDAQALGPEYLHDVQVARLRNTVRLRLLQPALPAPHHRAARVTVYAGHNLLGQGFCLSPQGSQDRPFTIADVARKCLSLAASRHSRLLEVLLNLPACLQDIQAIELRKMLPD